MSVYHTPRCRILWTNVASGPLSNLVDTDTVLHYQPLHLIMGVQIDPSIFQSPGYFSFNFDLFLNGERRGQRWIGWIPTELPTITLGWFSYTWRTAIELMGWGFYDVFLFRPSIRFNMWGKPGSKEPIPDEFAVAEEPHYISVDTE